MLHEIENKIEGAFVFPEMARCDLMIHLAFHSPEVNGFLLVCDNLSQLKSIQLKTNYRIKLLGTAAESSQLG